MNKRQLLLWLLVLGFFWVVFSYLPQIRVLMNTLAHGRLEWIAAAVVFQSLYFVFFTASYQAAFAIVGMESRWRDLLRDFSPQGLPPEEATPLLVMRALAQLKLAARTWRGELIDASATGLGLLLTAKPADAAEEKKPEQAWPKIIEGKVNKWFTEVTLLGQESVTDPGKTVDAIRKDLGKALGGDVHVHGFVRYALGEGIEKKTDDLATEVAKMTAG